MDDPSDPTNEPGYYYKVLGLPVDADESQIKRAYRKMAIRYHPDKNPGQEDKFKEVQAAYQILSDEDKKEVYDRMGTEGLRMYEMVGDKRFMDVIEHAMMAGCGCLLFTVLTTVQLALLCVKFAGHVDWKWAETLIPLLIVEILVLLAFIILEFIVPDEDEEDDDSADKKKDATTEDNEDSLGKPRPFLTVVGSLLTSLVFWGMVCVCTFSSLLVVHLDSPSSVSVEALFSVLYVYEAMCFLSVWIDALFGKVTVLVKKKEWEKDPENARSKVGDDAKKDMDEEADEDEDEMIEVEAGLSGGDKVKIVVLGTLSIGLRVAVELCIMFKLTGDIDSWGVALIPAYILIAKFMLASCVMCVAASSFKEAAGAVRGMFCVVCCTLVAALLTLILLAVKYDTGADYDGVAVISPLIVIFSLFFGLPLLCGCLACWYSVCCGRGGDGSGEDGGFRVPPMLIKGPAAPLYDTFSNKTK